MIGLALAKSMYAVPTWTRIVALVQHAALRAAITGGSQDAPSVYACYRFTAKLRQYSDTLARCIDRVTRSLGEQLPEYGRNVAMDGSDMPAYANGQRFVPRVVESASSFRSGRLLDNESIHALPLLDTAKARRFKVETAAMDKGYGVRPVYEGCEDRDVRPVILLRETSGVKKDWLKTPTCEHGAWRFAGSDSKRGASKWRCPTGECKPASVWSGCSR